MVAVAIGHVHLVGGRIHHEIRGAAHVLRVGAAAAHARLAELLEELAFPREFQELRIFGAAAGQPHDVFLIHEHAVLGLRPVVAWARATPRVNQRAALIELEDRRRRHAAIRFRRVVIRAGEALVGQQARGPLQDIKVILPIDSQSSDGADRPVLGQRLRKRGVVLEDRDLDFLSVTDRGILPGPDQQEREAECGSGDSLRIHARLLGAT